MNPKRQRVSGLSWGIVFFLAALMSGMGKDAVGGLEPSKLKMGLWLKADSGVLTNQNGFVRVWEDQSGQGNHAVQTNMVSMPLWMTRAGEQPVLYFDGVTNYLEIAHATSLSVTGDVSIFAVVRIDDYSTLNGILGKTFTNYPAPFDFYLHEDNGIPYFLRGDKFTFSWLHGNSPVVAKQLSVVSVVIKGTNGIIYVNGVYGGNAPMIAPSVDAGGPARIGTRADFAAHLKGDLGELILLNKAVNRTELMGIHRYLGENYGINVVLDVTIASPPMMERLEGQTAVLSIKVAASSPRVDFQWQKDGADILGATNAIYTTPPLTLEDDGHSYRVRVSAAGARRFSDATIVNVMPDTEPVTVSTAAFLLQDQSSLPTVATKIENPGIPFGAKTNDVKTVKENVTILPPYSPRFWQTGEEPSRNVIPSIAQTADGYLWVGTQGGLARFDGQQFEFIPIGPEKRDLRVAAVLAEENGGLWVGTTQGLFLRRNESWEKIALPPGVDEGILSLLTDGEGALWIGTRAGLARFKDGKCTFAGDGNPPGSAAQKRGFPQPVRSIAKALDGSPWISAADNLLLLKNGVVTTNVSFSAFKADFVRSICCRRDGSVWAGGNAGVMRSKDGILTQYGKTNGLPDNGVTAVYEDHEGHLWIGTFGGLCRLANDKFVVEMTPDGEAYDQVFCIFEDRENNLWVGAKNGLYRLRVQQFITYTTRHGLAHNNVVSVYEDAEGAIWIGTWGGGLHCLRGGKITIYSAEKNRAMRNNLILAQLGTRDGSLWFGEDYDGGIYRLRNGQVRNQSEQFGFVRNAVRALMEDAEGKMWVGLATGGLKTEAGGKTTSYGSKEGLPTYAIRCLLQSQDGRIWVGTEAGLCLFTNGTFLTFTTTNGLSDNTILSIYEDKEQTMWIGTGKGLCRFAHGNFAARTSHKGLTDDTVLEILEDNLQNLWLATRQGIVRVRKKDVNAFLDGKTDAVAATTFGKADGMVSQVCVGVAKPSACKSRDGRLWFATTKGLAVTDPQLQISRNDRVPPVLIQEIMADKRNVLPPGHDRVSSVAGKTPSDTASALAHDLTIPASRGELEFHYTALSYAEPEKNRFKYKLEGLDTDWVDAGGRHLAFYNNVAPGHYRFRVTACNNDGVWNETGASVGIVLKPLYWQTWWFRGFIAATSLFLAAAAARFVTKRRMQFVLQRLEQQNALEKERTRIARDMHDELGARLTEIAVLSTLTAKSKNQPAIVENQSERISVATADVIENLHTIVWSVNPANDTLEKLVDHIREHAEQFLETSSIGCRILVPKELPRHALSSEVRHHLFMTVKEALNNIVKHAHSTEVNISVAVKEDSLNILVEDNGRGFATSGVMRGNGLINMEKRMTEIGGKFACQSAPGKGTRISMEAPLSR